MGGANCIIHAASRHSEDEPARFGFIVSKTVGNAVTRNRVRRRFQAIAHQLIASGYSGVDVVVRVLPHATETSFTDLEKQCTQQLTRVTQRVRRESPADST